GVHPDARWTVRPLARAADGRHVVWSVGAEKGGERLELAATDVDLEHAAQVDSDPELLASRHTRERIEDSAHARGLDVPGRGPDREAMDLLRAGEWRVGGEPAGHPVRPGRRVPARIFDQRVGQDAVRSLVVDPGAAVLPVENGDAPGPGQGVEGRVGPCRIGIDLELDVALFAGLRCGIGDLPERDDVADGAWRLAGQPKERETVLAQRQIDGGRFQRGALVWPVDHR